ncbi:MAG: hypothetical protein JWM58_2849 [Rhizobium sp.]|nr:hypothetical protein [Rhizobium sp.]
MARLALLLSVLFYASAASAQEEKPAAQGATMGQLIADGYEIKAAVPNGKRFVVFLQKDTTGYACELANLSSSQCGKIN